MQISPFPLLWLTLALELLGGAPTPALDCHEGLENRMAAETARLETLYAQADAHGPGFRIHPSSDRDTASFYLRGDDRIVVLLHGFMASPPEMAPLAEHLHRSLGVSVYAPLIPGFGAGDRVMETVRFPQWRRATAEAIDAAARCHRELAVVGYSLGGGLAVDYLFTSDRTESSTIESVTLLAPYFRGAKWQLSSLGVTPSRIFLGTLRHVFRLRRVRLERLYGLSRGRYRDLEILLEDPFTYDQALSIRGARNMLTLTAQLKKHRRPVDTPTLLVISESDRTTNWRYAERFARKNFSNLSPIQRLAKKRRVPHEVVVPHPDLNPEAERLFEAVARFIDSNWEVE